MRPCCLTHACRRMRAIRHPTRICCCLHMRHYKPLLTVSVRYTLHGPATLNGNRWGFIHTRKRCLFGGGALERARTNSCECYEAGFMRARVESGAANRQRRLQRPPPPCALITEATLHRRRALHAAVQRGCGVGVSRGTCQAVRMTGRRAREKPQGLLLRVLMLARSLPTKIASASAGAQTSSLAHPARAADEDNGNTTAARFISTGAGAPTQAQHPVRVVQVR